MWKRQVWKAPRISTHYLTQRQTLSALLHGRTKIFQLTTSRRGRRTAVFPSGIIANISTHYLTQRQTAHKRYVPVSAVFQLTTSRRGRLCQLCRRSNGSSISTHYLTQRQTTRSDLVLITLGFQLTTSRRGRPMCPLCPWAGLYFNSLPHAEVDQSNRT